MKINIGKVRKGNTVIRGRFVLIIKVFIRYIINTKTDTKTNSELTRIGIGDI